MTDMEHRDTGTSAKDQGREGMEGARDQGQQRTEGARDQVDERAQGTRQAEGRSSTVPKARESKETRRGAAAGAAAGAATGASAGWMTYAGSVLVILGVFQLIWGITSLVNSDLFIVTSSGLAVAFNYTAWAWVHIALAVLLVCTGLAVFARQGWARYVGIGLAAIAAFANFLTMAAFPIWSIVMIAVDFLVIYALAVHGREMGMSARRDARRDAIT